MGLFLARGGDQIETRTAPADTQASGLLFRFLFTAAAHGCRGQTATGQRQQPQSSVEGDGGARRGATTIGITIDPIRIAWQLTIVLRELVADFGPQKSAANSRSIRVTTSVIR